MQYLTSYIIVQVSCLILAWFFLRGQRFNEWGVQRFYLIAVVATELAGNWVRIGLGKSNLSVYNTFLWVEAMAIGWLLYRFIQPLTAKPMRLVYWGWLFLFTCSYLLEWHFNTQSHLYFNYSIVLMCLVFTLACGYYYYCLLMRMPVQDIRLYPPFWWVSGTLIFYFGGLMINSAIDLLFDRPIAVGHFYLHQLITNLLNFMMYGLWTYSYFIRYRHPNF